MTVDGKTFGLPCPFMVMATQNPLPIIYTALKFPKPDDTVDQYAYAGLFKLFIKLFAILLVVAAYGQIIDHLENGPLRV